VVAVYLTRHSHVVDTPLTDKLWHLYEVAYEGAAAQAVTREMLYRTEFDEALADPTNRLWVLWDDADPIGMGLVATDIGRTRYLSRAFFEHKFPEHMRRGAVHYIMWLVVHPAHRATGAIVRLSREGMALEAADGALLVFDSPEVNQPNLRGGFAEMMARLAKSVAGPAPLHHLETQHYFAVDFQAVREPDSTVQLARPSAAGV
jgi:GNAT superfamily N-acetyltransferase